MADKGHSGGRDEERIIGNWTNGDPRCEVAENLAQLYS